jgi:hypothetical protein
MSDDVNRSSWDQTKSSTVNEAQASAAAPAPAKKKKIFLDLAPLQLPQALCSDCGGRMACVPIRDKKGRVEQNKVKFFCDDCECGFEAALVYYNGQNIKYEDPQTRGRRA